MVSKEKIDNIVELSKQMQSVLSSGDNFEDVKIRINERLINSKEVQYYFDALEIPYQTFPIKSIIQNETNITFHHSLSAKIILSINLLISKVFPKLDYRIFIIYANEPNERMVKVSTIGSYIKRDVYYGNISREINPSEFLSLKIEEIDNISFFEKYHNEYYDESNCLLELDKFQIEEMMEENGELVKENGPEDDYGQWAQDDFEDDLRRNGMDPDIELDRS